jgi:hypothetical protein
MPLNTILTPTVPSAASVSCLFEIINACTRVSALTGHKKNLHYDASGIIRVEVEFKKKKN